MEEETLRRRIFLELLNPARILDGRVSYAVMFECAAKDLEEVSELGKDNGFSVRVGFSKPKEVSAECVDFSRERRADQVNIFDLRQRVLTDLRINLRFCAGSNQTTL